MNLLVTVLSFHASQRPHPPPQSRAEILLTSNKPARPVAASPYTLKTLRDLALVNDQLREAAAAVQPAAAAFALSDASVKELAALGASLQTSTSQLASSLGALSAAVKGGAADAPRVALDPLVRDDEVSTPASLKSLTLQASRLHQQVAEERQLIEILEEKERGAASRTRDAFEQIDTNGDGELTFTEFENGAKALLSSSDLAMQAELQSRFDKADTTGSGTLGYEEFVQLITGLQAEAIGPLRQAFTKGLQELLGVSLQMIALTLSAELAAVGRAKPGRARQLSKYVDRWCDLESEASCVFAQSPYDTPYDLPSETLDAAAAVAPPAAAAGVGGAVAGTSGVVVSSSGGYTGQVAPSAVVQNNGTDSSSSVSRVAAAFNRPPARLEPVAVAEKCETLLEAVGSLAGALSLPNATTANEGFARRITKQLAYAISGFRSAMAFCARGFSILGRDCIEVASLFQQVFRRNEGMGPKDWALVRRVTIDVVMLVPYTIIMIVPLSPPGHVFAFSLMKRCFPNAVPSPFTAERQDIYEIYSRIAFESTKSSARAVVPAVVATASTGGGGGGAAAVVAGGGGGGGDGGGPSVAAKAASAAAGAKKAASTAVVASKKAKAAGGVVFRAMGRAWKAVRNSENATSSSTSSDADDDQ